MANLWAFHSTFNYSNSSPLSCNVEIVVKGWRGERFGFNPLRDRLRKFPQCGLTEGSLTEPFFAVTPPPQ